MNYSTIQGLRKRGVTIMETVFSPHTADNVEQSIAKNTVAICLNMKTNWVLVDLEKRYQSVYARKIRSISYNAHKFEQFRLSIESNNISYDDIPTLFHDQICETGPHSVTKHKLSKIASKLETMQKYMREFFEKSFSSSCGVFWCKKCDENNTVIRYDEEQYTPVCVMCLTCGGRWKE